MIRIYKNFYKISFVSSISAKQLIDPILLEASSYVSGTGDTHSNILVEGGIPLTREDIGIYYADLNPILYASDITYDLVFKVKYTIDAPDNKILISRFRIKPYNISNQISYEISNSNKIDYEINNSVIEYEIIGTYN